jgi:hypothetical protein
MSPVVVIGVALIELTLSTLLMLGTHPTPLGYVTISVFVIFGCYWLITAARTRSLMCACAGTAEFDPATPQALGAVVLTCLLQAGAVLTWMRLARRYGTGGIEPIAIAAWIAPFTLLFFGAFLRPRISVRLAR